MVGAGESHCEMGRTRVHEPAHPPDRSRARARKSVLPLADLLRRAQIVGSQIAIEPGLGFRLIVIDRDREIGGADERRRIAACLLGIPLDLRPALGKGLGIAGPRGEP